MVDEPKPQQDNKVHQFRDPGRAAGDESRPRANGRMPYPNEVVGNTNQPPFEVVGTDALSPLLMQVGFPVTKEQLIERIGHARMPIDHRSTRTIREVLERAVPTHFQTSRDVELAVERVLVDFLPLTDRSKRRGEEFTNRRPRSGTGS